MKTKILSLIALIIVSGFTTFAILSFDNVDSSQQLNEDRKLPTFENISLSIHADVHLMQGEKQLVRIEASDKTLKLIKTEVNGKTLNISFNKNFVSNTGKITIYITIPKIEALRVTGSGNITADKAITSNEMDMVVTGSGDIELAKLQCKELNAMISGSGDININDGQITNELEVAVTGSGDADFENIPTKEADISITGSGTVKVNTSEKLNIQITGSGDVYYKGAGTINVDITGSGKARKL